MIPGLSLFPEPSETIEGVGHLIRMGATTCEAVVGRCLSRIDEWDGQVRAWAHVDREGALQQSRDLDRELAEGNDRGPLHGIPIGVKDIIDVKGLPTGLGVRSGPGRKAADEDAEIVANLRAAGAIILGKTVTTPYAWIDPPPTANPWDLGRTPGGSSSGSAAAVACGMCLGAFGTQTGGSIIRPAAFCGVVGFKPSRAIFDTTGIMPFAPGLDTPGPLARSVEGARLLCEGAVERDGDEDAMWAKVPRVPKDHPRRIGRLRGYFERGADPSAIRAVDGAVDLLRREGAAIVEVELPRDFEDIRRIHRVVMAAEAAVEHGERLSRHPEEYPPRITELLREGASTLATDYLRASRSIWTIGEAIEGSMWLRGGAIDGPDELLDGLVMPAALGPAPDRSTTGDPVYNAPWTAFGNPAIALPTQLSGEGLPLAIQLVGSIFRIEGAFLEVAGWCESVFGNSRI